MIYFITLFVANHIFPRVLHFRINMSEDKPLSMAFVNSLRSSVLPTLNVQGEFFANR